MEALAKEQLSSDSEDEDYIPPEVKEPTLSLRKRSGGLELESDDEDDDDDELSDDADLVDAQVSHLHGSHAAGSSSASAGPSSAGAGPSSSGAAPSSAAGSRAEAGSSAVAGPPSATGASSVGAGSSFADASASNPAAGSFRLPAGASSVATAGASTGAGESANVASVVVDGIIAAETEKTAETGPGAEANVGKSEGDAVVASANGAPSAKVEEPVAKKPRVEKPAGNQSIEDIWADMNAGVTRAKEPTTATDAGIAAWLAPPPTEKKEFKITRLADLEKEVKRDEPLPKKKGRTGLEGALDVVRGKTDTVITKTKEQWKEFKKDDEISEELEKYKKDKNRYTDKVAFLQRSDVREWEYEQKGKRRR